MKEVWVKYRIAAAAILVIMAASACSSAKTAQTSAPKSAAFVGQSITDAKSALAGLPIKGRAPKTGYSREQFGVAWTDDNNDDLGHNGCDTRNDILRRDLTAPVSKDGSKCIVASGVLHDAYTGKTINWKRGQDTSAAVQIDHVVALSDAWQTGAQQLSADRRRDLANDPRNLQAVDGPTNQQKSDGDAATWLPPENSYRCTYVARQITVKSIYGLSVTQAEHDAMAGILASCR